MQVMTLDEWLMLGLIAGIPITFAILIMFQHILGYYLSNKYDPHFFKPPYFTEGEVAVYSSWPLSLMRYATYILFAAFPWSVHKRRFKGQTSPYLPGVYMKLACQLWTVCLLICILYVPTILIVL